MNAIICPAPFSMSKIETPIPDIGPNEVLVKITRVGICGTDLHAYQGNQPFFNYPRILGHELSGTVEVAGEHSKNLNKGDQVTVVPYIHCGECQACLAGQTNCCRDIQVFGVHIDGGMQEYISYPGDLLIKTNDLTCDEAALVEPLAIGAHSLKRAEVKKDDLVLIQGCGPIGIGVMMLAKYMGARVIVLDVNPKRLDYVRKHFDVDIVINPNMKTDLDRLNELLKVEKADVVIDATGNAQAIPGGLAHMRHGGKLVLVGIANTDICFHHPSLHARETTLLCSRNATMIDFQFVIKALKSGKLNAEDYVTRKVVYLDIVNQFNQWISPDSPDIKIVTEWD